MAKLIVEKGADLLDSFPPGITNPKELVLVGLQDNGFEQNEILDAMEDIFSTNIGRAVGKGYI